MMNTSNRRVSTQQGIVLISSIVMLVLMSLIAISMIRLGTRHTQVVNNEQLRVEAEAAANYALDLMLNDSANFWDVYKGSGKELQVNIGLKDISADSGSAITVRVRNLKCRRIEIIPNSKLIQSNGTMNYVSETDAPCFGDDDPQIKIFDTSNPANSGDKSLCVNALYEAQAQTSDDGLLGADVLITQGVNVRRSVLDLSTCD